ncbi:hypothetical protein [Desulforhopalus sp. 52FAK]
MNTVSGHQVNTDNWGIIAGLYPQLKSHITLSRHHFRGEISYVLEDSITKTRYGFSKEAYEVVGRLNGKFCSEEIYNYLQNKLEKQGPTQEAIVEIITQLSRMEALTDNKLLERLGQIPAQKQPQGNNLIDQLKNSPLFLRLPLFNPSPIITRYRNVVQGLYTKFFLSLLLILFAFAACTLFLNLPELSHNPLDRIFSQHNLFILWLLYPIVKTIHEFAHAFSVKYYGGDVTEMGLMLLLFVPVPYVNASDSSSFTNKWQRIIVAGSGILAELALASLALLLWTIVEPGVIRTIAFNTMLICGVSTLIFNGNPLVRFDGYYILSDLIEIPNLATKSSSYLWHQGLRFFTGIELGKPAETSRKEKRWLLFYGISSFCYRLTIYGSIFYFFASKLGPIGAIIGLLGIGQLLYKPLQQRILPLLRSRKYGSKRRTLFSLLTLYLAVIIGIITLIPLPYTTPTEGVVLQPEDSLIKIQSSGIITSIVATPGTVVEKGDVLIVAEDDELHHAILLLESQLVELRLKEVAAFAESPFEARIIREKILDLSDRLEHKKKQKRNLTVTSPLTGNFIVQQSGELIGKFFKQGDLLGFIQNDATIIRTVISQVDIDPILENLSDIRISVVSEPGKNFTGTVLSEHPHGTFKLPSQTLAAEGGGRIITNPDDPAQLMTIEEMFQLDIQLTTPIHKPFAESRAYIRFYHGYQPLLFRLVRRLQQLFLTQFRG